MIRGTLRLLGLIARLVLLTIVVAVGNLIAMNWGTVWTSCLNLIP